MATKYTDLRWIDLHNTFNRASYSKLLKPTARDEAGRRVVHQTSRRPDRRSTTPYRAGAAAARSVRSLRAQLRRLRGGRSGVVDGARLVFVERNFGSAGGVAHGGSPALRLARARMRRPESSSSTFWNAVEHGAAIIGDRRLVGRLGGSNFAMACSRSRTRFRSHRRPATRHGWRCAAIPPAATAKNHPPPTAKDSGNRPRRRRRSPHSAAAIWRSATAISGRRCSRVEGTPAGTEGSVGSDVLCGISRSSGFLPTSTAMAWAYCARATPSAIRLDCAFSNWVRAAMTSEGGVVPASPWLPTTRRYSL